MLTQTRIRVRLVSFWEVTVSSTKKVNLSEKTRTAGRRPMETIVLSDDEEDAPRTGLCIHCGQVSKPHACPHGTVKIMKPLSKSKCHPAKKQRTSAVAAAVKV